MFTLVYSTDKSVIRYRSHSSPLYTVRCLYSNSIDLKTENEQSLSMNFLHFAYSMRYIIIYSK